MKMIETKMLKKKGDIFSLLEDVAKVGSIEKYEIFACISSAIQ